MKTTVKHKPKPKPAASIPAPEFWKLRLYVAGQTPRSIAALANIKRLCEERLPGRYTVEVIDLLEHPRLAKDDEIIAIPTLVRRLPAPIRKVIGDLSNTQRVLVGLDLVAEPKPACGPVPAGSKIESDLAGLE